MPELPEVNTFQKYFDQTAIGQTIYDVIIHDSKIIRNVEAEQFRSQCQKQKFISSQRRGKYLFAELSNKHHILLHFGMTGDLKYYLEEQDRPKYERFAFHFDNDYKLGFDCMRKFARILYLEDKDAYIRSIKLGEDALEISWENFAKKAKNKQTSIKGFLLNQKNLAGVGNLYADEVFYQTKVHPASKVSKIPQKKLQEIFHKTQEVLKIAIERSAHYKDYPEDWFWEWRKKGMKSSKGELVVEKIAGRTTYYIEKYQKRY